MARSQADTIKIVIAVVALVAAGFLMLWQFTDIFAGKPQGAKVKLSPEKQKELDEQFEEQEKIQRQLEKEGKIEIGGA